MTSVFVIDHILQNNCLSSIINTCIISLVINLLIIVDRQKKTWLWTSLKPGLPGNIQSLL